MEKILRKNKFGRNILINIKFHVEILEYVRNNFSEPFLFKDFMELKQDRTKNEYRNLFRRLIRNHWLLYNFQDKKISFSKKSFDYIKRFQTFTNPTGPLMKDKVKRITTEKIKFVYREDIFLGEY